MKKLEKQIVKLVNSVADNAYDTPTFFALYQPKVPVKPESKK